MFMVVPKSGVVPSFCTTLLLLLLLLRILFLIEAILHFQDCAAIVRTVAGAKVGGNGRPPAWETEAGP